MTDEDRKSYHIAAIGPYQIPEFDFLYNTLKVEHNALSFEKKIATIAGKEVFNNVSEAIVSALLEESKTSLVGKNEKTVLDEAARKSHEILADKIELDPEFQALISAEIQKMAAKLSHPNKVIAKLYKLVIYKEGDFFKEHIDSPHGNAEPMIFTASVQLHVAGKTPRGGNLKIGGKDVRSATENSIQLSLFYHDVPHSVALLQSGYRLSLIFDVVDSGIATDVPPHDVGQAFTKAITRGFESVAIMASHSYFSLNTDSLKGADKVFYDLARAHGAKSVEVCEVFQESGYPYRSIFRKEVLEVIQINEAFKTLYQEGDEEDDEEAKFVSSEDDGEEETKVQERPTKKFRRAKERYDEEEDIIPQYDEQDKFVAVGAKYRLGGTLFLAANTRHKLRFKGPEDAFLGNEGFDSKILSNLAIIAHFN